MNRNNETNIRHVGVDTPACGQCAHMEQLRSGLRRVCECKRALVGAFDEPCAKYVDIWQRDLFGEFDIYHKTLAYQQRHQKQFSI